MQHIKIIALSLRNAAQFMHSKLNELTFANLQILISGSMLYLYFEALEKNGQDVALVKYQMEHNGYSEQTAREEVVANSVPAILRDKATVKRVVETDRTLAKRIADFFKEFAASLRKIMQRLSDQPSWKQLDALKNDVETLQKISDAFFEALEGSQNKKTEGDSDAKNAIKDAGNGKKYVESDREVIFGNNPNKWGSQITNYINREIRKGKNVIVYASDGDALTITRDTAGKASFRNYVTLRNGEKRILTDKEYATKLRAEAHIDELAEVSRRGERNFPDRKNHPFAKDGFNYRTAYFKDKTGYYRLTISVGKNGLINTIYNVGKIKKKLSHQADKPQCGLKDPMGQRPQGKLLFPAVYQKQTRIARKTFPQKT